LVGTQTFLEWIRDDFGVKEADTAWMAIELASDDAAPDPAEPNPVYLRTP